MSISASSQAASANKMSNNTVPHGPSNVTNAIMQASQDTGVDFTYLMEKAAVESGFRTDLKASTSSATGLYQFIDGTWLAAMKAHGAEHGLQQFANAIQKRDDGGYSVASPELRRQILDLRKDPKISAELAAELTRDNKAYLETKLGGTIGSTELYLAHFLGAGGATRFLTAMHESPNRAARDVMPEAAGSNTAVFYDRASGQPKSLAQVYDRFAKKFSESSSDIVASAKSGSYGSDRSGSDRSGSPLDLMISNIAAGKNPIAALNSSPLSSYTMLALAALKIPDETRGDGKTAYGSRQMGEQAKISQGFNPVNSFRDHWSARKA
ncbi:MAG: hypothetical protein WCK65_04730 [Rhodospirillaceae bacterium]